MKPSYYCPNCGRKLEQGEYGLDTNTGSLHVAHCPDCGEIGSVVNNAEQALVKYCKENIPNFDLRYDLALDKEGKMRYPIEYADNQLYCEIYDRLEEWCAENGEDIENYSINEIF